MWCIPLCCFTISRYPEIYLLRKDSVGPCHTRGFSLTSAQASRAGAISNMRWKCRLKAKLHTQRAEPKPEPEPKPWFEKGPRKLYRQPTPMHFTQPLWQHIELYLNNFLRSRRKIYGHSNATAFSSWRLPRTGCLSRVTWALAPCHTRKLYRQLGGNLLQCMLQNHFQ